MKSNKSGKTLAQNAAGSATRPSLALTSVIVASPVLAGAPTTVDRRRAPQRATPTVWRRIRSVLFWGHLVTGVVAGVVILIMSFTGVLLAYERQIVEASAGSIGTPPTAGAQRLPIDSLLAIVRTSGVRPTAVAIRADPSAPVSVSVAPRRTLLVNAYTGAAGEGDAGVRSFYSAVERMHRSLAITGSMRAPLGTAITGASNLAFLGLLVSGFFLWWPRQWTRRAFRSVGLVNTQARPHPRLELAPRARHLELAGARGDRRFGRLHVVPVATAHAAAAHRRAGRCCARSGRARCAGWRSSGWRWRRPTRRGAPRAQGGGPNAGGEGRGERGQRGQGGRPISLEPAWRTAVADAPGWKSIQLRLPQGGADRVTATVSRTTTLRPDLRATLTIDARSGAVVDRQDYASFNTARKVRAWMRGLHTGEVGGIIGQTIAMLVSAASVVLVWTGLALSWRRLLRRMRRRASNDARAADDASLAYSG